MLPQIILKQRLIIHQPVAEKNTSGEKTVALFSTRISNGLGKDCFCRLPSMPSAGQRYVTPILLEVIIPGLNPFIRTVKRCRRIQYALYCTVKLAF
jgi:hypothetical protein